MSKEKELKDRLVELDDEYMCSIAAGTHRDPAEIESDAHNIIKQLIDDDSIEDIRSEEDAHDYVDKRKERFYQP